MVTRTGGVARVECPGKGDRFVRGGRCSILAGYRGLNTGGSRISSRFCVVKLRNGFGFLKTLAGDVNKSSYLGGAVAPGIEKGCC